MEISLDSAFCSGKTRLRRNHSQPVAKNLALDTRFGGRLATLPDVRPAHQIKTTLQRQVALIAAKTREKRIDFMAGSIVAPIALKIRSQNGSLQRRSTWEDSMRRPAALFTIVFAFGSIILVPSVGARADERAEGPTEIEKCQTISKPGSYRLVNNLTFSATTGACLTITTSSVSIDLAGFTINGPGFPISNRIHGGRDGDSSRDDTTGIAVRNGSIAGFSTGVDLGGDGSIVEGLRVFGSGCPCLSGIVAAGVVKGNTVLNIAGEPGEGVGISATGIVTGNYVTFSRVSDYFIGQGSTVIGNTAVGNPGTGVGIVVSCPSNVTDNTATGSLTNLSLNGTGCNNTNNVAP